MAKEINLLPDVTLKEEKESKTQKLLTIVSMLILVVGAVALIGVFTYHAVVQEEYKSVVKENENTQQKIIEYASTELTERALKSKLQTSGKVLAAAKDYKTIVEQIQSLVPDGISITDISMDKANKILLNGKANTSDNFSEYIKNVLDPEKGSKYFTDISLGNISSAKDGTMQFNVGMSLPGAKNAPAAAGATQPAPATNGGTQ